MLVGKRITLVAAMARNRAIGKDGKMPWHLPAELAHFKKTTLGHTIIMGRRTFESIGRPLPQRQNIVVSNNPYLRIAGCRVANSLEYAAEIADSEELMIIGGGMLYRHAMPVADRMVLTLVDCEPEADTFFPSWQPSDWLETSRVSVAADERNRYGFSVVEYLRIS